MDATDVKNNMQKVSSQRSVLFFVVVKKLVKNKSFIPQFLIVKI